MTLYYDHIGGFCGSGDKLWASEIKGEFGWLGALWNGCLLNLIKEVINLSDTAGE